MKPQDVQYKIDHIFRREFVHRLDEQMLKEIHMDLHRKLDDLLWNTLHNKFYYNIAAELNMRVQEDVLCE